MSFIVTSPPYNKKGLLKKVSANKNKIGEKNDRYKYQLKKAIIIWNKFEIDYDSYNDNMPESNQQWMTEVLNEMTRIIKPDGSIFFNHKPRRHKNRSLLPKRI